MNAGESFSQWIKRHRKMLGLTQAELAERVGCARITIQKIELDRRRPSQQIAGRIIDVLEISANERTTVLAQSRMVAPRSVWRSLPAQPTACIGRERELGELDALLADPACRAITLVGPGGIGKTRLALETVQRHVAAFANGAVAVPLVAAAGVEQVVFAIAEALGLPIAGPDQPQVQLANYLAPRTFLLLLDNVEQIAGLTQLIDILLQTAPTLKLLLTSRIAIHSRWAWAMAINGLAYPSDDSSVSLHEYASAQLFVQRARQASARFSVGTNDRAHVYRICRLVDGMPLAIELAAAWARVLPGAEIAARLTSNIDLLTTSQEDVPARHRSMQAVFEQTWHMLIETEREVLARLAVFRGGFTIEAAEQVADATPHLLAGLVDKSVLRVSATGRYDMHELVRQYATTQLERANGTTLAHDRHCAYYTAFVDRWAPQLRGGDQVGALAAVAAEIDNVRAGWEWAVEHDQFERIAIYSKDLWCFFELRGWYQQAYALYSHAAERLKLFELSEGAAQRARDLGLVRCLTQQAAYGARLSDPQLVRGVFDEGVALARRRGFHSDLVEPLIFMAWVANGNGKYAASLQYAEEVLAIASICGHGWGMANAQQLQGMVAAAAGDLVVAKRYWQQALHQFRANQDLRGTAMLCVSLASLALFEPEYATARVLLGEAFAASTALDDNVSLSYALSCMGILAALEGQYDEAWRHLLKALSLANTISSPWLMLDALTGIAHLHAQEGRSVEAYELAVLVLRMPLTMSSSSLLLGRLCTELECQLTPDEIAGATERGRTRDVREAASELLVAWGDSKRVVGRYSHRPRHE